MLNTKILFRSFHYPNFRLYFQGQSISLIGTWIQATAMPWLVYYLTNSTFLLGFVGFAGQIPTFLLGPFAGVWVDRWNKYRALIITQLLLMLQALAIALLYFSKLVHIWNLILLSVFMGCVNAFDMPLRQSFLVELIEKKEDLTNAIALNSSMVNVARLIGPSIAGVLISATNEGICFLVNAISFIFVVASLLRMKIPVHKKPSPYKNKLILKDLKEGITYVFGFPPLRNIILLLALVSLTGMPYTVLMPVFATKILHGGSHTFGFLMAASGVGALIGALYLASRKSVLGLGRIIPLSVGLFGAGLIAFSLSRNFIFSVIILHFTGLGMILNMASSNTILQTIADDDKRGRVMSFYTIAFIGMAPFGSLLAGSLASAIGAPLTLFIGGICCIIGAILFARKLNYIRSFIRPIYMRLGIIPETVPVALSNSQPPTPPEQ